VEHGETEKPEKQIHSVRDVSGRIGKCPRTIYRAIKANKIRVIRFGASLGIPDDEVRRILERGF
jgi:IS30 family transposase